MAVKLRLIRDVPQHENHSGRALKKGEEVFRYYGHTYGCLTSDGTACCDDLHGPFFEVPSDALEEVRRD